MSIYLDKLAHMQVIINCWYYVAQMHTWEEIQAHFNECIVLDDVMSQSELTIKVN